MVPTKQTEWSITVQKAFFKCDLIGVCGYLRSLRFLGDCRAPEKCPSKMKAHGDSKKGKIGRGGKGRDPKRGKISEILGDRGFKAWLRDSYPFD